MRDVPRRESIGTVEPRVSPIAPCDVRHCPDPGGHTVGMLPAFVAGMSQRYARSLQTDASAARASVQDSAPEDADSGPSMRLLSDGKKPVIELVTSFPQIRLYEAYRALRARGVQVVHTAVRRSGSSVVQLLHLAEADGTELTSRRLRETLATLSRECGLMLMRPPLGAVEWMEPKPAGGTTWQSFAT